MSDEGSKSRLKAAWHSIIADHDRNIRELQSDLKEISQIARNKMRDLQDQRRIKKQQTATTFDLWEGVNQGAGASVLSHFKHHWSEIHNSSAGSAEVATVMYSSILSLHQRMSQAHNIVSNACEELGQLPGIIKSVHQSREKVDAIGALIQSVEEGLRVYVRLSGTLEMERKKHSVSIQLDNHKEEQQAELRKWTELVATEKQKTLDRQEMLEQIAQRERQETFDSIFVQQMAEFKEKGEVDRPIVSEEETRQRGYSQVSLEEVEIDDNAGKEQLQEFLSDVAEGEKDPGNDDSKDEKKEEEEEGTTVSGKEEPEKETNNDEKD